MNQFRKLFKEATFESDVYIIPTKIENKDDNLIIQFSMHLDYNHEIVQVWHVTCHGVVNYKFVMDYVEDITVYTEHVLLWNDNQEHYRLFFSGKPTNSREVIGALYTKHEEVTEGWIQFGTFLNKMSLEKLLTAGYGVLGEGPYELLKSYKEVITEFGLSTSFMPIGNASNTGEYQLMVFSGSYVIAKGFSFHLVSDHSSVRGKP